MKYKKIGIIAAMATEMELLRQQMSEVTKTNIAGTDLYQGKIGQYEVALMLCGIGKVSAALGAQAMIMLAQPDCIINTGTAGAVANDLKVGDIVVADLTAEWDLDTMGLGNPMGYVYSLDQVFMEADKALSLEILNAIPEGEYARTGLVVSGDQFVDNDAKRNQILTHFPEAQCAEMEGSAIGHVCMQNQVPFAVVRCMSDTADGNSGVDFVEFMQVAGEKSAGILKNLLTR